MNRKLSKLLVANRGEIALRIIRTARTIGLRTVAIYSPIDARAAHVAAADEAYPIGESEPAASYLNIPAILNAARQSGAGAIHPGYGFLSERPAFARAAIEAGLVFVGPSADAMALLGDKIAARELAKKHGVPVVPGIDSADLPAARSFAKSSGLPILIKAAAGGGGRGMRVVDAAPGLRDALESAQREAIAAFGDGRLFVERYLVRPRHVEVQVLGDINGRIITIGDRDCSIQRRHQKIIEESPAPGLNEAIRTAMADAAIRLFHAAGYQNAGTAEFLVEGEDFYFLEANTRLQVEHPVTEMRFGYDLVAQQLKIAAGEPVDEPPAPRGHAIECRIYAEDAAHDFRPATGKALYLNFPAGPGVRVDSHLTAGAEVSPYYDGLLAKLVCWGADREQARERMAAALGEFMLLGVLNTAAFLREIMISDAFREIQLSTRFLAEFFPQWRINDDRMHEAAIMAALLTGGVTGLSSEKPGAAAHQVKTPWERLGHFELWNQR
ncbi:MAG: acetyl-CoA carboxylase biotin carboxylase subunit [Candidatus Binataceae bacterium]